MAIALIVAAGRGERLGSSTPKALVPLAGRPLVHWSAEVLLALPAIERVVVALPAGHEHLAPAGTLGVSGGGTRSESVARALAAAGPGDPVLVHDAARPLITAELAGEVITAARRDGVAAAIAASPVTDTVKRAAAADLVVRETIARSELWAVQTPQVFRREWLERAHAVPAETLAEATDDAWLVERAGGRVVIVPAPPENFKVTTPHDLRVAELLLGA